MLKYPVILCFGLLAAPAVAQDIDVSGLWQTPTGAHVQIADCGDGTPCGTIVKLSPGTEPDARDTENEDEALRERPILGLQMLAGFEKRGKRWQDGKVYDPKNGNTYSGSIWTTGDSSMKLKGCIIWPACRTQEWTRLEGARPLLPSR